MLARTRPIALFCLTVTVGLLLAGCGGVPAPETREPAEESASSTQESRESSEPAEPSPEEPPLNEDLACMIGQWDLDLADYSVQALEYLRSLNIPIETLTISGTQSIIITEETFGMSWGLQSDAVVHGVPISVSSEAVGLGEWLPNTDGENWFMISNWSYTIEPRVDEASVPVPPIFDPIGGQPIVAGCFGDALSLHADGAPLSGNFTRRR